jgi:hypothetical protein
LEAVDRLAPPDFGLDYCPVAGAGLGRLDLDGEA